jgi:5'(3')-deoxyribonucleotidase
MKFKEFINNNKNIDVYFDMDGVFAEYDIGNFDYNTIRPIKSVIKLMKELIDNNINVKILSICKNNKIVEEKYEWLEKHLPFFNKENAIFLSKEEIPNVESNELKSNYLKDNIDKSHTNILVDDDILVIKKIVKENQDVKVFHVSSIIE